ncbi:MAG: sugar transporter substrate-binding protein [Paenibacillaceae bacterium]|jgi:putative aldouronate transport system substrate-binding protein|nr:sugar transporter substrate-binding protein [Paenibacillaceae bacterium]
MRKTKWLSMGLAVMLFTTVFAGCSSDDANGSKEDKQTPAQTGGQKPAAVTLKITLPGDRPAAFDKVITEAEKRMADSLNVKLNVTFIPWSDLKQKTQIMLSAGDDLDLVFDAPWNTMNEMIAADNYAPLDDLLKQYGPNILKNLPPELMDANKFNGKIMGIPLNNKFKDPGATYVVRKDIREKLGVAPIKSYDELTKFLATVKEKMPDIVPYVTALPTGNMTIVPYSFRDVKDAPISTQALSQSLVLYHVGNDSKVYNLFDQMDPKVWDRIKETRKMYQDKIIHPDIMAVKGPDEFKKGKVAVIANNGFSVPGDFDAALKSVPGAQLEAITFFQSSDKQVSEFAAFNFISIPTRSKNKERAIQFLNWANEPANYDLLAYGIQGTHWEPAGENQYKVLGDGNAYTWFPYAWIWNPVTDRIKAGISEEEMAVEKYTRDSSNFTKSVLAGFKFDATPVANEITQYNSIEAKYYGPIMNGVVDPDEYWTKFKKEAESYVKKVQIELEKQISAFKK